MGGYISQDPIKLGGGLALYGYVMDTNSYVDLFGLTPLIPDAPTYSGIYHIQGADGRTYVGSAVNIKARLDSNSHPTATDIINSGDYKITYYEVNLGTASTRQEIDHVLRNHEQQIMDQFKYVPLENGNMNKNRPEAKNKNARNKKEVEQLGAGFTGTEETKIREGGSLCE